MSSSEPLPGTERELVALTFELDEMHHDAMRMTRRAFLAAAGVVSGGLVLTACGGRARGSTAAASRADLDRAAVGVALENLAVQTYQHALDGARGGRLGRVPPAVVTFATTSQRHHQDHADAWNALLQSAGRPRVTGVDVSLQHTTVQPALAAARTVSDVARLALQLEDVAAATYIDDIGVATDRGAIATAASIHPVEMQHAAILRFVLGEYPVPAAFAAAARARGRVDTIG